MPHKDITRRSEYHKAYMKKWYEKNKQKHLKYIRNNETNKKKWLDEIKSNFKCSRCQENHIACLDFHHIDPKSKEIGIAIALQKNWSKERILEEINKCIVLCSNCHRKLHYDEKRSVVQCRTVA